MSLRQILRVLWRLAVQADLNQITIEFSIFNIQTLEFALFNTPDLLQLDKNTIPVKIDVGYFFDSDNKMVVIDVRVDISASPKPESVVCHFISRFAYHIKNYDDAFVIKDGNITYPAQFLTTLVSISLSTARGLLAAKTEGSNLQGIYIPIVDPTNFQPLPNVPKAESAK